MLRWQPSTRSPANSDRHAQTEEKDLNAWNIPGNRPQPTSIDTVMKSFRASISKPHFLPSSNTSELRTPLIFLYNHFDVFPDDSEFVFLSVVLLALFCSSRFFQ